MARGDLHKSMTDFNLGQYESIDSYGADSSIEENIQVDEHAVKVRRSLEDFLEKKREHDMFDYLDDDDFSDDDFED